MRHNIAYNTKEDVTDMQLHQRAIASLQSQSESNEQSAVTSIGISSAHLQSDELDHLWR